MPRPRLPAGKPGRNLVATRALYAALAVILLTNQSAAEDQSPSAEPVTVAAGTADDRGVITHRVRSPYQAGETRVDVILPSDRKSGETFPVLYVLPVEAGDTNQWGDPVAEILKHRLADEHRLICVHPSFSQLPWYCDHANDPQIRQETYLLEVVLPLVERTYPVRAGREGRLLVGFSKSGWGAWSLLLRHPKLFQRAAAWDAPLLVERPNRYGMEPIFGSEANFEAYHLATSLERQAGALGDKPRLIHLGYDNFRDHHQRAHALLEKLGIPQIYRDGPRRKHQWSSGWLPEAVKLVVDPEGKSEAE